MYRIDSSLLFPCSMESMVFHRCAKDELEGVDMVWASIFELKIAKKLSVEQTRQRILWGMNQ